MVARNSGFDVLGHAVERLDALRGLGRAGERDPHGVVALTEAARARGERMERSHAAAEDDEGHGECQAGAEQEDAQRLPEAPPEPVDGHGRVELEHDGAVALPAHLEQLRLLEGREREPVDEPRRSLDGGGWPEGLDGVSGIVDPREPRDVGVAGAGLHHLLDHGVVADDGGSGHRRTREPHLLVELVAQHDTGVGHLAAEHGIQQRDTAYRQRQAGAENEASGEGETTPPGPGERHYCSTIFTSVVR
jgi:hypothetical protein